MKTKKLMSLIGLLSLLGSITVGLAQGTAFTYQGQLTDGGAPATGLFDFRFSIFDSASGGSQVAGPITNSAVAVSNGLFTAMLDFGGGVFTGSARWLEIGVRTNSGGAFTLLSPRQKLTPTPYAIFAGAASNITGTLPTSQLSGAIPSASLVGTYSGAVTFNNAANSFNGTFSGNGGGLTNLNASQLTSGTVPDARLAPNVARTTQVWLLGGNAGTTPGTHFLGTTDNQPLELRVNRLRALRLEPNASGAPNVIGGSPRNFVGTGVVGATLAGGGATNYGGFAYTNSILADFGTIGGGLANAIGPSADASSIGGGWGNSIAAGAWSATVAGGELNVIGTNAHWSAIGGGCDNYIAAGTTNATIAGGYWNYLGTEAHGSTLGGGTENYIVGDCWSATIAGGQLNYIGWTADYGAVSGGYNNSIENDALGATVAGGRDNSIGTNSYYSVVGGGWSNTITANAAYAVIPGGRANTATNYAFAAGRRARAIHTGSFVWGDSTDADIASTNANSVTMRASGGYRLFSNTNLTAGVYLAPGGGSWSSISDRNAKENFAPVNVREVLEKVAALPVTTWNYKSQDPSIRHIGPMAQDFKAAFGVGETDTGITSIDADGVALAAIQGLNQKLTDELKRRDAENAELRQRLARLEQLVEQLAK